MQLCFFVGSFIFGAVTKIYQDKFTSSHFVPLPLPLPTATEGNRSTKDLSLPPHYAPSKPCPPSQDTLGIPRSYATLLSCELVLCTWYNPAGWSPHLAKLMVFFSWEVSRDLRLRETWSWHPEDVRGNTSFHVCVFHQFYTERERESEISLWIYDICACVCTWHWVSKQYGNIFIWIEIPSAS